MKNQIQIEDYSLEQDILFAQVSLPALKGEANFFNLKFDAWDVIEAAISLKILNDTMDYDRGRSGQQLRVGYSHPAFPCQQKSAYPELEREPMYFSYQQIECEFSGEDREAIVLHIAMKDINITNALTLRAI